MREGRRPILAAVDIQDAFHNIPAGKDKKFTMALTEMEDGMNLDPGALQQFGEGSQHPG